jgi:small conductance mechanosensitive channel
MDVNAYIQKILVWSITSGVKILITLVFTLIALRFAKLLSNRFIRLLLKKNEDPEFQKRTQTLGSIVRYVLSVTFIAVATMIILRQTGVEIGPILAAAGVAGLAIGFGAQSLVKDVISGFFILMEDQIRVGDVIQVAGKGGLVERINLKTTILRDLAGNVHYIPNGQIDVVTNMTKEYSRYVFDIGIAYREDVDEVIQIIREVDEEMRSDPIYKEDILEPIEVLGLDQFADSAIIIKARTKTMPIKQWGVAREFNRRLKIKFDERDIEIPFPHVMLYMGQDKQGQSPPLNIELDGTGHLYKEGVRISNEKGRGSKETFQKTHKKKEDKS